MKSIGIFILFLLLVSFTHAQSFLPIPEAEDCGQPICPPILSFNQSTIDAVDAVGDALQNSNCAGSNKPFHCMMAKWVADKLPCLYHPSTPQGSLCVSGDEPTETKPDDSTPGTSDPDGEPQNPPPPKLGEENKVSKTLYLNPSARAHTWSFKDINMSRQDVIRAIYRMKNGDIIAKNQYGYTLHRHSAYWNKNKKDVVLIMHLKNKKGQTLGNPTLFTLDNQFYVADLASKN